jgi:uncharacterized protein with GYD domain
MLFCIMAEYTPETLNALMESPTTSRREAVQKLLEAAGGKLIEMYSTVADGPGALAIFDVEPNKAPAISGLIMSTGTVRNIKLMRLLTQDEVVAVRQTGKQLKDAYRPPGH